MQLWTSESIASSVEVASIFEITSPPRPIEWSSVSAVPPDTAAG